MSDRPIIRLLNVTKRFGEDVVAVDNVSLTVSAGQLVVLLGFSGCGKSTMLRLIAGLETPNEGEIWLNDQCVASDQIWLPPESRRVGLVFQDYALFPHLKVNENVAFPLNGQTNNQRRQRVAEMLTLAGLPDLGDRYPHQLSGGQQQRVALARALAPQPTVVLLDEPFSNLDASLRRSVREDVRQILKSAGTTTIFVTHDQEEALSLADVVAVMSQGRILQIDTPQRLYLQPAHREVAAFVGEANFLEGTADGSTVTCVLGQLPLFQPMSGPADILLRPEMIDLRPATENGHGYVERTVFYGYSQVVTVQLNNGPTLQVRADPRLQLQAAMPVELETSGPVMAYPRKTN